MPRLVNGRPVRSARGGKRGISDRDLRELRASDIARGSKSSLPKGATGASIHWLCSDVEETAKDYVIPRRSLSQQQYLKMYPTEPTFEDRLTRTYITPSVHVAGKTPAQVKIRVVSLGTTIVAGKMFTKIDYITEIISPSPDNYVESTDSKLVRRGEDTLLIRGVPFVDINTEIDRGEFKRLTSQSKRIKNERSDNSPIPDNPLINLHR